jgi:MFS family permease
MERIGRRAVLVGAAVLHGVGIAGFGLAPSWPLFVLAMVPAGLGAGCLDEAER